MSHFRTISKRINHICIFSFLLSSWGGISFATSVMADPLQGSRMARWEADLGTIYITPKRVVTEEGEVSENCSVYTQEQIEDTPARDLNELLQYIPGVDVKVANKFGQSGAISIHGSESRHVLLMVDGIPFNTQLTGQSNPTRIALGHIDRIEVIKGAASSAWGSSLGGVVNVITKDVGDTKVPTGRFASTFSEFSTTKNSLELSGRMADLGYFISGSYMETSGIKSISGADEKDIFSKVSYPLGDQLKLTGSFGYKGANVHDGINPNGKWYAYPYNTRYGKVALDFDNDENISGTLAYKYNDQDIVSDRYNGTTWVLESTTQSSNLYQGISIVNRMQFYEDNIFVWGGDFDWHKLKSNKYLDVSKSISMQAPYANYTMKFNDVNLTGGLRFDNNQRFGSQWSPSIGVVYFLDEEQNTLIRSRVSRAFNAPPLLWIYNDDPPWVNPNPDLKAERAIVYELGFEKEFLSAVNLKLDLYLSDIKDAIALNRKEYKQDNFKKLRRQGVELKADYAINDQLSIYGGGGFNDVVNLQTNEVVRDSGIARQSFNFGINYKQENGFSCHLMGYYDRWSSAAALEPNDRKVILDLRIAQMLSELKQGMDLELFMNVYNLTNSKYWSNITFPLPKRYFEGGFSLSF